MAKRLAIILVIIVVVAAIFMAVSGNSYQPIVDQPLIVVALNLVFLTLVLFLIAIIAARSYLSTAILQMLWLGAGSLAFSLGSLFYSLQQDTDPNSALTSYSIGTLIAAVFYLHELFPGLNNANTRTTIFRQRLKNVLIYNLSILAGLVAIDVLAALDIFPVFYNAMTGPTFPAYLVMMSVIILFLIAFINNQVLYFRTRLDFFFWYSFALLFIAAGLLFLILAPFDSPLSWLGRATQYIGGIFFIMAIVNSLKQARVKNIRIEKALASFYRDPRANYELLMKSSGDAIIGLDGNGIILMWNPAAERTFGYCRSEVLGLDISRLFDIKDGDYFRKKLTSLNQTNLDSVIADTQQELNARRNNGEYLPVSITFSSRRLTEGWMVVIIAFSIRFKSTSLL